MNDGLSYSELEEAKQEDGLYIDEGKYKLLTYYLVATIVVTRHFGIRDVRGYHIITY